MRTTIKSRMSLKFGQIRPSIAGLAYCRVSCRVRGPAKNQCLHSFSVAIDIILSKFADNEEMHTILNKFEIWPDWTTDNRVSYPGVFKNTTLDL